MGFPIELVTAVNPNDIVHRTFKSGDWRMLPDVKPTWASAMDIQVNFKSLIEYFRIFSNVIIVIGLKFKCHTTTKTSTT